MSSLITLRLYEDDWKTPKVWATPKLSAILEKDNSTVLDSVDMIEVWSWFYKYNFVEYNKSELYFFFVDWEAYDWVNILDSYWNKWDRWKFSGWIWLDTEKLAQEIRDAKKGKMKKDSIGEYIFNLKNTSEKEIISSINIMFESMMIKSDTFLIGVKELISTIKIPKQISVIDIVKPIENTINKSILEYSVNMSKWLETLQDTLVNTISAIEKYDDSEVLNESKNIVLEIEKLKNNIDNIEIINTKVDDNNEISTNLTTITEKIIEELKEINRKMVIAFSRLNNNK